MALGDFLETLTRAINERTMAKEFGTDFRERERKLALNERTAGSADLLRRAQLKASTRAWDAKLRAAQQLHPDLDPESALAAMEGEDIKLGRDVKGAQLDLVKAQAKKALQPTFRNPMKITTEEGVFLYNPQSGEKSRFGDRPRASTGAGGAEGAFAANPFNVTDAQGNTRLAVRVKGGGYQFVDKIGEEAVGPGPTADQRNQERYDVMLPTQVAAIRQALSNVKAATGNSWTGSLDALRPGSPAFMATQNYTRLIEGIAATAARAMGDTRISDLDSKRYARLYGVANQLAATPPGTDLAESLLKQAEELMSGLSEARRQARLPAGAAESEPSFEGISSGFSSGPAGEEPELTEDALFGDEE